MNYLPFEHFEAEMQRALQADRAPVRDGRVTLAGRTFSDCRLKGRRTVHAFIEELGPWADAICFSSRGEFIANAQEIDVTGSPIVNPDFMGLDCWPFNPSNPGHAA